MVTDLPTRADWESVAFGNGRFVAVARYSNIAAYSDDGITWAQTTLPVSEDWGSAAYGNGRFVAVAYGTNIAIYSDDGITWAQTTLPVSEDGVSVAYGNGRFVAVARNSTAVAYSEDGINWLTTSPAYLSDVNGTDITSEVANAILPPYTSADAGKVLTVGADGTLSWQSPT